VHRKKNVNKDRYGCCLEEYKKIDREFHRSTPVSRNSSYVSDVFFSFMSDLDGSYWNHFVGQRAQE
jgi:hypothetical protein